MRTAIACVLAGGCGGGRISCPHDAVPACVESALTIQQGVYGLAVSDPNDIAGRCEPVTAIAGLRFVVAAPDCAVAIAQTVTDGSGMYEIAVAPGRYWLVYGDGGGCIPITVPDGLLRVDYGRNPFEWIGVVTPCAP
ncbi:MAG: hypothetical protein ACM31C_10415 [Acidobacteriota bacterium]